MNRANAWPRIDFVVYGSLMLLLLATVGLALVDLGRWNLVAALAIAGAKAALVLLFFMHAKDGPRVTWLFSTAAALLLAILLILTLADFISRGWGGIPGK